MHGNVCRGDLPLKRLAEYVGMNERAVGLGEHQVPVAVGNADGFSLGILARAVLVQHLHSPAVEVDHTLAALRLRGTLLHLVTH
jgi:hypothetical protein